MRLRRWWWPGDTLAVRILAPGAAALVVLLAVSMGVHAILLQRATERGTAEIALHRLAPALASIASTSNGRPELAAALSAPDLKITWGIAPVVSQSSWWFVLDEKHSTQLNEIIHEIRIAPGEFDAAHGLLSAATISAQIADGSWVNAQVLAVSLLSADDTAFRIAVGGVAIVLLLGATLAARAVAAPLVELRNAVRSMSSEGEITLPPARGPREVRELAEALETSTRRARDLLRQRSLALGALSHDIMSPLARLKLRVDDLSDPLRQRILLDLAEMEEMVSDVLAYLRGGDGGGEPVILLSVAATVQVVVDEFADAGAAVVERRLDDVSILARPVALKRAIRNLVENAVKYGLDPWIEVTASRNHVVVRVGDKGSGLQPEDLARAFEPFFRGNRARSRGEGSGLGLSTARAIAEAHGGTLTLTSIPGKGSEAVLRLPRPAGADSGR